MHEFYPAQQAMAEKYLGKNIPDIIDIEKNMSLVLVNQQETISFARPRTPNIILFGSFHVSSKLAPLPKVINIFDILLKVFNIGIIAYTLIQTVTLLA